MFDLFTNSMHNIFIPIPIAPGVILTFSIFGIILPLFIFSIFIFLFCRLFDFELPIIKSILYSHQKDFFDERKSYNENKFYKDKPHSWNMYSRDDYKAIYKENKLKNKRRK
ncbi:MAG: hypothetical protein RR290_02355 [Clostridia bacterium]